MMISREFDRDRAAAGMTVLKVPAGAQIKLTIQSEAVVWAGTHWLKRQLWCPGEDCPACGSNARREKGYFIAELHMPQNSLYVLVEAVPATIARFVEQLRFEQEEWRPGIKFEASRPAKNRAFQMNYLGNDGIALEGFKSDRKSMSAAAVLNGLPPLGPEETPEEFSNRVSSIARNLLLTAIS